MYYKTRAINLFGSQHNDLFNTDGTTKTNNSGGIQGGISNGMPIVFRTAFKPVATILQKQASISKDGEEVILEGKGRHDPCVVSRAVPIIEGMAALVILDFYLQRKAGMFNGAVISSLVDISSGFAAASFYEDDAYVVTVELKVNFSQPAMGKAIISKSRVIRGGKKISVVQTDIYSPSANNEEQHHVATSLVTMMRIR